MDFLTNIVPLIGVALCAMAGCQVALWTANSIGFRSQLRQQYQQRQNEFRRQLETAAAQSNLPTAEDAGKWRGFRTFRVDRIEQESSHVTSVYLVPVDGKPICRFHPGQHLIFRFQIPAYPKPVVRCYSLSDGPGKSYYRISVKQVLPPKGQPHLPGGKASQYVHHELRCGQELDIKAPAGDFFLKEDSKKPVVLLAGGIGITPMISMIERLVELRSERLVLLVYGVGNSTEHPFKNYLTQISNQHANIHLLTCYSRPTPHDRLGIDYQFQGHASWDLLHNVLPDLDCEFYLCGPPAFMRSVSDGLLAGGVKKTSIRYEAFGPASISQPANNGNLVSENLMSHAIKFAASDTIANWDGTHASLLEFAEANGINIDSGCRAGSCGSCSTEVIEGDVEYGDGKKFDCPPNHCLLCVARPSGPLELRA